jgi:hypothetical protein
MKKLSLLCLLMILLSSCSTKYIILSKNCSNGYCEYELMNCKEYSPDNIISECDYSEGACIKEDRKGRTKEIKRNCIK